MRIRIKKKKVKAFMKTLNSVLENNSRNMFAVSIFSEMMYCNGDIRKKYEVVLKWERRMAHISKALLGVVS